MIRWTGLAPWEFEFPFAGSLITTFLDTEPAVDPAALVVDLLQFSLPERVYQLVLESQLPPQIVDLSFTVNS